MSDAAYRMLRITPACAGKTLKIPVRYFATEDHPRVCGENRMS